MNLLKKIGIILCVVLLAACSKAETADKSSASAAGSDKATQVQAAPVVGDTQAGNKPDAGPLVSRNPLMNAAPLGLEVGYANLAGVKQKLGGIASLNNTGSNMHSGGVMLESNGQGLGVEGLSHVLLVFDKNETLIAVVMRMRKDLNATYRKLADKYKTVNRNIDEFMGNGNAKLEKGDSWIVVDAPHLSFDMEVIYSKKDFMETVNRNNAEAQSKKEQAQKDSL